MVKEGNPVDTTLKKLPTRECLMPSASTWPCYNKGLPEDRKFVTDNSDLKSCGMFRQRSLIQVLTAVLALDLTTDGPRLIQNPRRK